MRDRRHVSFIVLLLALTVGGAIGWAAEEPPGQKSRREKAFADLDTEVAKVVPLVTKVETMSPCAGVPAPAALAALPKPGLKPGMKPAIKVAKPAVIKLGKPFCPEKYVPIKAKLKDLVNVVSSNSGADARAGAVISHWPDYITDVEHRLVDLANLKANQQSAALTAKQCKAIDDAMLKRAKTALVNKSLDELDAARTEASKDKTTVRDMISHQESVAAQMTSWEASVRLFAPSGPHDKAWKPVADAFHASAKAMLDQWNADWAKAITQCAEPLKGEDHAEHRKLEDQLYETLKKDLDDDMTKWRESAKVLYRHDCTSMKQLYQDICELDGDEEEVELKQQVEEQADKMKVEMENKVHEEWTRLAGFRSRALRLEAVRNGRMGTAAAYGVWRDALKEFVTEVGKEEALITAVMSKGIGRGSRHPKIQLWINFGKQQHSRLEDQERFQCALADEQYCAQRDAADKCIRYKRPDCVNVMECKIWEFKPPGDRAKQRGDAQLDGYQKLLQKHYQFALDLSLQHKLHYEPVGGTPFFRELERRCVKNGKVELSTELFQYERCTEEYECAPQAK